MKNIDKHAALPNSNIRDFLAKQLGHGYEGEVENIKLRIAGLQEELEIAKRSQAARELMKSIDKHEALPSSNIRDFLEKQLGHGYEGEVENLRLLIAGLQEELEIAKRSQAARELMKSRGWEEFDVSDEVEDYKTGEYFSFVGTQEERDLVFGL
jgi:hypothetical protein